MLKVRPSELNDYEFLDILLSMLGRDYNEFENEKVKWEQTRFLAYYAAAGNLKKGTRIKDLITFSWEKRQIGITKEQREHIEKLKAEGHPIFK